MRKMYFDNNGIRRLEAILDRTLTDLKIDEATGYARSSREFIAKMLLKMELEAKPVDTAASQLSARATSYGMSRKAAKSHPTTSD